MSQHCYDIIEITVLAFGCIVGLVTLILVSIYTQSTYSIAQSAHDTALEAAKTAKITEESLEISSKILEEMRETRDAQTAPYVFVYFDQMRRESPTKILLVIKNAGRGPARNVQVAFDPKLQNNGTYLLKHIQQLTKPFLRYHRAERYAMPLLPRLNTGIRSRRYLYGTEFAPATTAV